MPMKKLLLLSLLLGLGAMLSPPVQAETHLQEMVIVDQEVDSLLTIDVAPVSVLEEKPAPVPDTEGVVVAPRFTATHFAERDIVVPIAQRKRMIPPLESTLYRSSRQQNSIETWHYHYGHWMLC